jgi:hypothetical protein
MEQSNRKGAARVRCRKGTGLPVSSFRHGGRLCVRSDVEATTTMKPPPRCAGKEGARDNEDEGLKPRAAGSRTPGRACARKRYGLFSKRKGRLEQGDAACSDAQRYCRSKVMSLRKPSAVAGVVAGAMATSSKHTKAKPAAPLRAWALTGWRRLLGLAAKVSLDCKTLALGEMTFSLSEPANQTHELKT